MRRRAFLAGLPVLLAQAAVASDTAAAPAASLPGRYEASWHATVPGGSHGYGVALLPPGAAPPADWVYPNVPGVLAVGFCTYDPPTENPFDADRNIDGNPEREVSLHWDGVEMVRKLSPVDLKGETDVRVSAEYVVGGAEVSVHVGRTAVYDRHFVPGVLPYAAAQAVWGGGATLTDMKLRPVGSIPPPAPPIRVRAFDRQLSDIKHRSSTNETDFPADTSAIGRVICTLTLAETPDGLDKWDRIANLYLYDEHGERFEILRYMTPYHKAYTWQADVTDLLPLLTGRRKMELSCETYGPGWLVTVDFDFYPGPLKRRPYKVVNLWNTVAVIGEADKPFAEAVPVKTIAIDPAARHVAARLVVTGHGQAPNTDNAAEFISLWRKLTVNGQKTYTNTLWKTDNYLNPCRPQGGTWKYDRAGWGPGTVVEPWIVDITRDVKSGQDATFRYEIQPYTNKTPDHGNPARHIIESQVIFYK